MLKLFYSNVLYLLVMGNYAFGQEVKRPIYNHYTYQYLLNESTPILYRIGSAEGGTHYSFANKMPDNEIDSICKHWDIPYDEWLQGMTLASIPPKYFYRKGCQEEARTTIDSLTLSKEQSIYSNYGHFYLTGGDVFKIAYDSIERGYDKHPYDFCMYENTHSCISLDSVTYILGRDMPLFHYGISKNQHPTYLIVGFCPQIGIIYYYYPIQNVKISLAYINKLPLDCYINYNVCITPFCEIK